VPLPSPDKSNAATGAPAGGGAVCAAGGGGGGRDLAGGANAAVLLAGGSGNRMRGAVRDKCLEPLAGGPCALARCVVAFAESGVVSRLVIVCRDAAQRGEIAKLLATLPAPVAALEVTYAAGGAERQFSVLNGLDACPAGTALVFIHDTARPLITPEVLRELARAAGTAGAAVLAHRVKDTIKRVPVAAAGSAAAGATAGAAAGGAAQLLEDLDRSLLWAMETPQVFRHALILDAMRRAAAEGARVTDDVAAAVRAGHPVALVENFLPNPKITDPADLRLIEFLTATPVPARPARQR
jgi:2-C-methyl-D-erythritol 4-phosphate cytidylyltransferase